MDKDYPFQILLESYKAVREEIKTALTLQQNILSWTSVSVGVLLIFAFNVWQKSIIYTFIFFMVLFPSASYMYLNIWLTEVARMMRGGRYLHFVENGLNTFSENDITPLLHEHWLRDTTNPKDNRHFTFGYRSGIAIYHGIIVFSHTVSIYIFFTHDELCGLKLYIYALIFALSTILLNIGLILSTRKRVKKYIM